MASDAQTIMTMSMKKIVESRTRRGGPSLHRNLLIAGVLFKARDVLIAQSTVTVVKSTPAVEAVDCDTERLSSTVDDDVKCERTKADATVSPVEGVDSKSDGKENVPPPSKQPPVTPDITDLPPSTTENSSRLRKRLSGDVATSADVPCKIPRDDASAERSDHQTPSTAVNVVDDDRISTTNVEDSSCTQRGQSSTSAGAHERGLVSSSMSRTVVRRTSTGNRLPSSSTVSCLADTPLVRPFFVVQVV